MPVVARVAQWTERPSAEQRVCGSTLVHRFRREPQSDTKIEACSVVCDRASPSVSRGRLAQFMTPSPSDKVMCIIVELISKTC